MIIGITGPARSGKDTTAQIIHDNYLTSSIIVSFADSIKDMLRAIGLTESHLNGDLKDRTNPLYGVTNRHLLQTLGTEWARSMHPDFWILTLQQRIESLRLLNRELTVIIPDVRFENEASYVRKHGRLIHITDRGGIDSTHSSEAGVEQHPSDYVINNKRDIHHLTGQVLDFLLSVGK